ncbi:MAG: hypothetical protein COU90_04595 [Candidatus Ryanbacteria bacterium CG10_big_fil_rev_8_21_14_0_10_43_42]|uniref:Cation-transporting P-type ATPase N-terminal domain-containing protein n=1 Tax=Candidatus Ryanbacteria bacterium CG10_big_fil_rev_8_21_14_0_10_43_42 TaxID=1974864 RepID=A0A2M8KW32_9BACT|nr:MAG: hypothetical protein COU90_04595 [Candidatus Ryanbacteria bacterium CG10_big_fil_rev_8_21_14_0_10_43_42]
MQNKKEWHTISEKDIKQLLEVDVHAGLSSQEAARRLARWGENRITKKQEFRLLSIIWHQFKNPLIIILMGAGGISFFLGEYTDATIIFLTIVVNAFVGVIQEGRASRAFAKLQEHVTKHAVVLRGGHEQQIESAQIVPGDVVVLRTGDSVPADARIMEARNVRVNESALTGEWIDIDKMPGVVPPETHLTDRTNMVWAGTLMEDGWARVLVVNTANDTQFGKISLLVGETRKVRTPLQKSMASLAKTISMFVLATVILIFFLGVLRGQSVAEMFITSVAIAVAAVPEGLPIAVTVILALGMERILKRGGLVKKLTAAETLGSTSIILTDKTGTLTQGRMQVSAVQTAFHLFQKKPAGDTPIEHTGNTFALHIGVFTSDAFIENPEADLAEWQVRGTPTDKALLLAGIQGGVRLTDALLKEPKLDFLPFESERRFAASLHKGIKTGTTLYVTGAPELILAHAARVQMEKSTTILSKIRCGFLREEYERMTSDGNRVVAVGFKKETMSVIPSDSGEELLEGLTFVGFIAFHDPLRPDAAESIALAKQAGLRPIIMTGDHKLTARKIGQEIGIDVDSQIVLEGKDLEAMDDETLQARAPDIGVYARVLPHQKLRIAEAWQRRGAIVAMTGDGVNDAPALKRADVGVALGSGTEVAKEAADVVLLENSFAALVAAIKQGRVIVDNLRKVITFVFATGFTEIILVGGALLFGFPLPVLASQILWTNLVGEGLLNFAFALEPEEDDVMKQKPRKGGHIITREMWFLILVIGVVTDVLLFGLFLFLSRLGYTIENIRTIMFVGLTVDSLFFAYSLRSLRRPFWRIRAFSNPFFLFAFALSVALLLSVFYIPALGELLSVTTLDSLEVGLIVALGIIDVILIEVGKRYIRRKSAIGGK